MTSSDSVPAPLCYPTYRKALAALPAIRAAASQSDLLTRIVPCASRGCRSICTWMHSSTDGPPPSHRSLTPTCRWAKTPRVRTSGSPPLRSSCTFRGDHPRYRLVSRVHLFASLLAYPLRFFPKKTHWRRLLPRSHLPALTRVSPKIPERRRSRHVLRQLPSE